MLLNALAKVGLYPKRSATCLIWVRHRPLQSQWRKLL